MTILLQTENSDGDTHLAVSRKKPPYGRVASDRDAPEQPEGRPAPCCRVEWLDAKTARAKTARAKCSSPKRAPRSRTPRREARRRIGG
eukprot:476100-Prorocentrum_minimum.AAC.2